MSAAVLVFHKLREHGIRFCQLRDESYESDDFADMDLLVDPTRFAETIELLKHQGYRVRTSQRYIPCKTALTKFESGRFVVIDLHAEVVQDGIVLMNADRVLSRVRPYGESFLPQEADLAAILVLHNLIGKGSIQEKHAPTLCQLHQATNRTAFLESLEHEQLAELVQTVINDLPHFTANPVNASPVREKVLAIYSRRDHSWSLRRLRRRFRHWCHERSLRTRAPLYALTGVDGVGKSALSNALVETLEQPGGFRVATIYMGPWGHYLLPFMRGELYVPGWSITTSEWLAAMFKNRASRVSLRETIAIVRKFVRRQPLSDEEYQAHAALRESSRLFLTLRYVRSVVSSTRFLCVLTMEMFYRYALAYRYRRRGITVISDRYIYDLMTGRMHELIPQFSRIRRFLCWIFPQPTRVFLLHNDPQTILARKDDLAEDTLHEFIAVYEQLAERHNFKKIKTDRPARTLAEQIIGEHFDEIIAMAGKR